MSGKRGYTAPPQDERCNGNVILKDGSGAQCMHRRAAGSTFCRQHVSCDICDEPIEAGDETITPLHSDHCKECRGSEPHVGHWNCAEDAWTRQEERAIAERYSA